MADNTPLIPLARKENISSEATGSDKLWGPEIRKYVQDIRKGAIDDPDFLRVYEATQKGLGQYTTEEVKSMGMEDPFLPAAIKRTTPESRKVRQVLTEERGKFPLVELGLDPRRVITHPLNLNMAGRYIPRPFGKSRIERSSSPSIWKELISRSDRPKLFEQGDVLLSESQEHPKNIIFHEAAHRGLKILQFNTGYKLPRLTGNLTISKTGIASKKTPLLSENYNEETWVRLLEHSLYVDPVKPDEQRKGTEDWWNGRFAVPIDTLLNKPEIKETLLDIQKKAEMLRRKKGFPKGLTHFQKGGTNMADEMMQEQMEFAGLIPDPNEVDPVSGNEIPLGATAEGVRDDETVAISPGEFVIPEYAVNYHGVKFYIETLQVAKHGLDQIERMGLVGNPDEEQIPETTPLPERADTPVNTEQAIADTEEEVPMEYQTGGVVLNEIGEPMTFQEQPALQPTYNIPEVPELENLTVSQKSAIHTLQQKQQSRV